MQTSFFSEYRSDPQEVISRGQYPTPNWFARELYDHYYADIDQNHHVLDPSCGDGSLL
jgi:hypothetical protein